MKTWLQQLFHRLQPAPAGLLTQRDRVRALYATPLSFPRDYERPTYLRRDRAVIQP